MIPESCPQWLAHLIASFERFHRASQLLQLLALPADMSTVEQNGAPMWRQHSLPSGAQWSGTGHQHCCDIACLKEHCGAVLGHQRSIDIASRQQHDCRAIQGINVASTWPAVKSTVEWYGAPTWHQHCLPSRALWSCMGHQCRVNITCSKNHGGAVRGTNVVSTLPAVTSTVELYGAPT